MSQTSAFGTRWLSIVALLSTAFVVVTASTPRRTDGPAVPGPRLTLTAIHIQLESSIPADGDTVLTGLDRATLVFSAAVESKLSSVRWIGPAGDTISLRVSADPDSPETLITEALPGENGPQKLVWRSVSIDGHQVAGEIVFFVAAPEFAAPAPAEIVAAPDLPAVTENLGQAATEATATSEFSTSRIIARGLGLFCLLGFAGLLWFGMGTTILDEPKPHQVASVLGLGATLLLTVDLLLWMSGLRLPGVGLTETFTTVLGTRSGAVEIWRVGLAGAAFLLFTGTGLVRIGSVLAIGAVVIGALGGHQAAIQPMLSLPANALHLGAAAVWTGGILLVSVWPIRSDGSEVGSGWTFPRIVRRVSAAALLASGVILLTAVIQDVLYLPSLGAIFSSGYGKLMLAKSAGFAALISFGAYNRLRLIPALDASEAGARPLRKNVRLELIVVIVTVLVAVVLSQVPPPME
jgi:copper transport protein